MTIKTKRWNDEIEADDGYRLLVCRYRPRALPKAKETWSDWNKNLGPSKELHAKIYGKHDEPISWEEFRKEYLKEMEAQQPAIAALAERVANGETITLLCSSACTDETRCHRSLLRELIEKQFPISR